MEIKLDSKSIIIGCLTTAMGFSFMAGRSVEGNGHGKYRTEINANNTVVLLDTENGDYLIAPDLHDVENVKWLRGNFVPTYIQSKPGKNK